MPLSTTYKTSPLISPKFTLGTPLSRPKRPNGLHIAALGSTRIPHGDSTFGTQGLGPPDIRLSFVVPEVQPRVDLFVIVHGERNGILHSFWHSSHYTAMGSCRATTAYSQLGLFLRNIPITH
ncbi:hypothetical protein Tco_0471941 [Tanacetum coccineum]